MLRRLAYLALPSAVLAVFAAAAPAAADTPQAPDAGDVAGELSSGAVYVDDSISDVFPQAELDALQATADEAETPTYFVLLPEGSIQSQSAADAFLSELSDDVGPGTYAMFAGSGGFATYSTELDGRELGQAERSAVQQSGGNQIDAMAIFGAEADELATAPPVSGPGVVMLGLLALAVAGGGYFMYNSNRRRREREAQELADIKKMASEDVTRLGEDVAGLEIDLGKVDEPTRQDYTHAMDSYERAKAALDTIGKPDDVQQITNALEDGRYYMSATRARLNGEPVPERRSPCFFNPQHGPSIEDVMWAPPGGTQRMVPACENCGRAVKMGGHPDVRMVEVDGERRPYYDAGPAFAPYAGGYFGMSMMMGMFSGMMMGSMMGSMMGAGMMGGMGDAGMDGGDMGGGDFGGGDFGDFGGFDF
jgi:hypothetical protein